MILVFDVWKKSQALKGMGLKYQGKKSVAVYFGSWGYRKLSTSWQFYDIYFYIFTTWRYFFSDEDILWGIEHVVSFEKKWGFSLRFPFLISISISNFYKLTWVLMRQDFFDIFLSYLLNSLQLTFQHLCCRLGNGSGGKDGSCYCEA